MQNNKVSMPIVRIPSCKVKKKVYLQPHQDGEPQSALHAEIQAVHQYGLVFHIIFQLF